MDAYVHEVHKLKYKMTSEIIRLAKNLIALA